MEATGEQEATGLLDKILPPRLEDAGLEDCALAPDSIKEAFLKAATAVQSRAATIFTSSGDEADGSQSGCVEDPWPVAKDVTDAVVGVSPGEGLSDAVIGVSREPDAPGACAPEKGGGLVEEGGDKVVIGGDKAEEETVKGKGCVDGLKGLENEEKEKNGNGGEEEEEKSERPSLVEGFV